MVAVHCGDLASPTSELVETTAQAVVLAKRGSIHTPGNLVLAIVLPICFVLFVVPWILRWAYLKYTGRSWTGCFQSTDEADEGRAAAAKERYAPRAPMELRRSDEAHGLESAPPQYDEKDASSEYDDRKSVGSV